MAGRPVDSDQGEQVKGQILGMDVRRQPPLDADPHIARLALADGLGREHMLDLRRTDPEREGAERAVGRGMAVAADDRHSRLRTSLFRADDMDDAAPPIAHRERLERSEEHPSELQSLMRISYAIF